MNVVKPEVRNHKNDVILVVDDVTELREAIAFDFTRKGFQVLMANSGRAALEVLKNNRVDVILSDVRMPDGDGIELLDAVKQKNVFIPVVIFITGYADISLEEAYGRGADAVFSKPYDRKVLYQTVCNALQPIDKKFLRKASRVETDLSIHVKSIKSAHTFNAKIRNIGRGGMFLDLHEQFPEELEEVEFRLQTDFEPILTVEGEGVVRWVRSTSTDPQFPTGCGIEFHQLEVESNKKMVELINFLKTKALIPRS